MSAIIHWISMTLSYWYREAWLYTSHLDKQQWLFLLIVTTAAGFLCLRGFGSRAKY